MKFNFYFLALLFFVFSCSHFSKKEDSNPKENQEGKLINNQALLFSIELETDTINYIVIDTVLDKKKPLFLWCQGSLPTPLFFKKDSLTYFMGGGIQNFDYKKIVEQYHLVVISMPKTPVVANYESLNDQWYYVPDKSKPYQCSKEFYQTNYLQFYVNRANTVINFLKENSWIDTNNMVIAGHSQGTKIATKISVYNPLISATGLFAPNPFGRADESIRTARFDAQLGKITWEKADSIISETYDYYKKACNKDSLKKDPRLNGAASWSERYYDDYLLIDNPIFMAYGSKDRTSDLCDLVPLFFIEAHNDNLTIKKYNSLEHNFFEMENGQVNYEKGHWEEVMNSFLDWLE